MKTYKNSEFLLVLITGLDDAKQKALSDIWADTVGYNYS